MASKAVFGIVADQPRATLLVKDLNEAGFTTDDISVLFPDKLGTRDFAHAAHSKAPEGAVVGAGVGVAVGTVVALLIAGGAMVLPGLATLLAAGPLVAVLIGAVAGAAVGAGVGALVGLGMPEMEAKRYEGKVRDGNILFSVHTRDAAGIARVKKIYRAHAVSDIGTAREAPAPEPVTVAAPAVPPRLA